MTPKQAKLLLDAFQAASYICTFHVLCRPHVRGLPCGRLPSFARRSAADPVQQRNASARKSSWSRSSVPSSRQGQPVHRTYQTVDNRAQIDDPWSAAELRRGQERFERHPLLIGQIARASFASHARASP